MSKQCFLFSLTNLYSPAVKSLVSKNPKKIFKNKHPFKDFIGSLVYIYINKI